MTEADIRAAHPDWTDEQVKAELARQTNPPAATPPASGTGDADRDAAFARERRAREAAEQRAKEAEEKLAEEARKKAEEEGRWKDLAEQERKEKEALKAEKDAERARSNAEKTAAGMKFKDTGYALYLLAADNIDLSDPAAVKAGLERIASDRSDLITGTAPPPSGGPAGGSKGDAPKLTLADIRGMTPAQVRALPDDAVTEALKAG